MSDDLNSQTKNIITDSQKLDTELQFDPALEEGRASPLRITAYLIAGLAVVGFGRNHPSAAKRRFSEMPLRAYDVRLIGAKLTLRLGALARFIRALGRPICMIRNGV